MNMTMKYCLACIDIIIESHIEPCNRFILIHNHIILLYVSRLINSIDELDLLVDRVRTISVAGFCSHTPSLPASVCSWISSYVATKLYYTN